MAGGRISGARAAFAATVRSVFILQRHDMVEQPDSPAQHVAFVQLPGSESLKVARWHDGVWLNEKLKPFVEPPVCWYSVEVRK